MIPATMTLFRRHRSKPQTSMAVASNVRAASIGMEIIRADGTRIPVGTVCEYHANPLVRWWRNRRARRNLERLYREHPQYRPTERQP